MVTIKVDKIKEYMRQKEYTNKKFSNIVGITEKELEKILSGDLEFKFLSLEKLARFLDIPINWLFDSDKSEVQTTFYV